MPATGCGESFSRVAVAHTGSTEARGAYVDERISVVRGSAGMPRERKRVDVTRRLRVSVIPAPAASVELDLTLGR